ncbi:MAG: ORF6N domain-containing protein [Ignavibacteriales bacterium]|nr:MAG: ORF6N domain-containing protein [Ignavibacteriales bacterium]
MPLPIKIGTVAQLIRFIRGEKVILDRDIAQLYNVETRALKQAVKRNIKRFPLDFMFKLTESEVAAMVSQNVIPSKKYFGGSKPMAFTEQGVAMLSSVLNSERAIEINIAIMRTFVKLRQLIESNKNLAKKIVALESKYDGQFQIVFEAIRQLMKEDNKHKNRIGF